MTQVRWTVESAMVELRETFPEVQIIIGIRDCGEETITPRETTWEYSAQIGMNGKEFSADSLSKLLSQVRKWRRR